MNLTDLGSGSFVGAGFPSLSLCLVVLGDAAAVGPVVGLAIVSYPFRLCVAVDLVPVIGLAVGFVVIVDSS